MSEYTMFSNKNGLTSHVEDLMGSEGNYEIAKKLTDLLIDREYWIIEWNGYFSTDKWDNLDDGEFFDLWEETDKIQKQLKDLEKLEGS